MMRGNSVESTGGFVIPDFTKMFGGTIGGQKKKRPD